MNLFSQDNMDAVRVDRVKEIVTKLKKACDAYYQSDSPVMSDADFDKLRDELIELDPNNDFLKTIGAPVDGSELKKVKHEIPMGSLKKINVTHESRF